MIQRDSESFPLDPEQASVFLRFAEKPDLDDDEGKFVVHTGNGRMHFFAMERNDKHVRVYSSNLSQVVVMTHAEYDKLSAAFDLTYFVPVYDRDDLPWPMDGSGPTDDEYDLVGGMDVALQYTTPVDVCSCGKALGKCRSVTASLVTALGMTAVEHTALRCTDKAKCGKVYWYNYKWCGASKVNTVCLEEVTALFITTTLGFSLDFIKFMDALHFRAAMSAAAVPFALDHLAAANRYNALQFQEDYRDALFAYRVMLEMTKDEPFAFTLGAELTAADVKHYDEVCHNDKFPPSNSHMTKELILDGHEKVQLRLEKDEPSPKHAGRPKKNADPKTAKRYNNGWFMAVTSSGRIVGVEQMLHPEDNAITTKTVEKVLSTGKYKKVNFLVLDRMCKWAPKELTKFPQIKLASCDKWHGFRHGCKCQYNPYIVKPLMQRLKGVNSSIAESTFAWFRKYAGTYHRETRDGLRWWAMQLTKSRREWVAAAGQACD